MLIMCCSKCGDVVRLFEGRDRACLCGQSVFTTNRPVDDSDYFCVIMDLYGEKKTLGWVQRFVNVVNVEDYGWELAIVHSRHGITRGFVCNMAPTPGDKEFCATLSCRGE